MKETIKIVKNFTPAQRINIVLLSMLYCCYLLITTLQNDVKIAREGRAKLFELYNECVTNKNK